MYDEKTSILIGMYEQLPANQARGTNIERMLTETAKLRGSAAAARLRIGMILHIDRARTRA